MEGQICCPKCGQQLPMEDVNLDRMLGKCAGCQRVFALAETEWGRSSQFAPAAFSSHEPVRPRYSQPSSVKIVEDAAGLKMSIRWFQPLHIFMLFFCLFWDGFLVVWYSVALSAPKLIFPMLLFPLLHVAAGVFLTYYMVAGFINTTEVTVARGRLKVSHGPLRWFGGTDEDASAFSQFFIVEKRGSKGRRYYELCALMQGGSKVAFLTGLGEDTLRYIEQELESHLNIRDQRVQGEHAG